VSSDTIIFLELMITLGIVVGFGLWELHKLKLYERQSEDPKRGEED
jgi:hypothetical protein